jgi:hypothetical protein
MSQIKSSSVGCAREDRLDTNITNNWDHQIGCYLHSAVSRSITAKYFDTFMFAEIARCLGWNSTSVCGKQVILMANVRTL